MHPECPASLSIVENLIQYYPISPGLVAVTLRIVLGAIRATCLRVRYPRSWSATGRDSGDLDPTTRRLRPTMTDAVATPRELTEAEIAELLAPRSAWTRADVRRSAAVAFVSSIVFFGALGFLIGRSSGWEAVRQAFFSSPDFQAAFPRN